MRRDSDGVNPLSSSCGLDDRSDYDTSKEIKDTKGVSLDCTQDEEDGVQTTKCVRLI